MLANLVRLSTVSLLLSTGFRIATAGPSSAAPIQRLIAGADAIAIGRVSGEVVNGKTVATLTVSRVLKGSVGVGRAISLTWEGSRPVSRPLAALDGLFFLKGQGSSWTILPAMNGNVDFEHTFFVYGAQKLPVTVAGASPNTVEDNVFAELVTIAESPAAPQYGAQFDLVGAYSQLKSPFAQLVVNRPSSSPRLAIASLRTQLIEGDSQGLARIERDYAVVLNQPFGTDILEDLRSYTGADPASVASLSRLVTSAAVDKRIRAASAHALARIHTPATLPVLVALLDSDDVSLRTFGIGGLAMFANNVPTGKFEPSAGDWPYRTDATIAHSAMDERLVSANSEYYVGFWKSWWQENRAKLGY